MKRLAVLLPNSWQYELHRHHFQREIRLGCSCTDEKEYALQNTLLGVGERALNIGAIVGHYTMRMAELVGPSVRGIAMEPVPDTSSLLAANVRLFACATYHC